MTEFSFRHAELEDIAEVVPLSVPRHLAALSTQVANSICYVGSVDGRAVCIFGLYPMQGEYEAWFVVHPAMRVDSRSSGLVRAIMKIMRRIPSGATIRCLIPVGHITGVRLAKLLGFTTSEPPPDPRFWCRTLNT